MKERSGFKGYKKLSKEEINWKVLNKKAEDANVPDVIKACPSILHTLENFIKDTNGTLPIPSILNKIKHIHQKDIVDDKMWEDNKLLILISKLNLDAKQHNPEVNKEYFNLGKQTHDLDIDPSNTDAFHGLMPNKS